MKSLVLIVLTFLFFIGNAQAYVGPGLGVGVIGAIVGVVLTVIMLIVGIFWYPIKRMFKKNDPEETLEEDKTTEVQSQSAKTDTEVKKEEQQ